MEVIAVIGSREWPQSHQVRKFIATLPQDTVIVTGGWWNRESTVNPVVSPTRGVDRWAAEAAKDRGLTVVLVAADYDKYSKYAGIRRNPVTVGLANRVVAFWDGVSNGTRNSLDEAKKLGKPVEIIRPEPERVG